MIVGRCADYILKDVENVLRIYVHAPFDYCVARAQEVHPALSEDEVKKLIRKTDKHRADYYQYFTGRNWKDADNYDLCLNSSQFGWNNSTGWGKVRCAGQGVSGYHAELMKRNGKGGETTYRILIVEDDPGIAGAIVRQAALWELEARCVQDFRAVLEEFQAYAPHLVVMDIFAPFFQWLSLVYGDPPDLPRADPVSSPPLPTI